MTPHELAKYDIGAKLMTQAFVSSTVDEKMVDLFIAKREAAAKDEI